jgi:hypothetical protein
MGDKASDIRRNVMDRGFAAAILASHELAEGVLFWVE